MPTFTVATIAADGALIFRDYNTDGVLASGVYQPQLSEIRQLFGVIGVAANANSAIDTSQDDPDWAFAFLASDGVSILSGQRTSTTTLGLPVPSAWYGGVTATAGLAAQTRFPDIMHEVLHGQSLGEGVEAFTSGNGGSVGLTIADTGWGNLRFARGFNTWSATSNPATPALRAASDFALVSQTDVFAETSGPGFSDHMKARLSSRYSMVDQSLKSPRILSSFGARGSTQLTGINKRDNVGGAAIGTSTTSLTVATGAQTLTVPAGMLTQWGAVLIGGGTVGLVNSAQPSMYMGGTVTSYSGTTLVVNVTSVGAAGTSATWNIVTSNTQLPGGFYATAIDDVVRANAVAIASGKSYAVSNVAWMQGEYNANNTIFEGGPSVTYAVATSDYRQRLILLASDFDADIRAITGQKRTVPFVTYQTLSFPACEAQLQAQLMPNIYMVGPHYAMPSALQNANLALGFWRWGGDIHLSADGQRWYGEMRAKVVHRILFENELWQPLRPIAARKIDALTVDVDFYVPRGPLAIDTTWFAKMAGWGFRVYSGSLDALANAQAPTSIAVTGPITVRFGFATAIPSGALIGTSNTQFYDLGVSPAVASVGTGPNSTLGSFPQFTLTIASDLSTALAPLIAEGAFHVTSGAKSGTIRAVSFSGGTTVMTGEVRYLTGAAFAAGDVLVFSGPYARTNLRDSDSDGALYNFGDPSFGTRYGQLYPMWNWAVLFAGLSIQGA